MCRLIQQNVVQFGKSKKGCLEYAMISDAVIKRIYHPWCLYVTKLVIGDVAELIVEKLLLNGQMTLTQVVESVKKDISSEEHGTDKIVSNDY